MRPVIKAGEARFAMPPLTLEKPETSIDLQRSYSKLTFCHPQATGIIPQGSSKCADRSFVFNNRKVNETQGKKTAQNMLVLL